ncbi:MULTISPECIES: hypothetical protein [unclassified Nostoc]|uniref:hypothetical protein n=1 Tax=unclassified Nostoc TaxID=2593658 RepID=UPI0026827237|nr:hypothetical protein [Nostoc sp. 'Peltigera membranacea cyanobiont' N6]
MGRLIVRSDRSDENTSQMWSVDNYHRMIAARILGDRGVELLADEIVEMTPEPPLHKTDCANILYTRWLS